MGQKIITFTLLAVMLLALAMPHFANAQPIRTRDDLIGFLGFLARFAFTIFLIIAVISYIYAAYMFLSAAGEEEKLRRARWTLLWGVAAMAIAILSFSAKRVIQAFLESR